MARRISRKELKRDEFVEATVDAGHWLERNWAEVLKWGAGLLIVVVLVLAGLAYLRTSREAAQKRFAEALVSYEDAQEDGFSDPASLEAALVTFDEVGSSSAPAADIARFYQGATLHRLGRSEEAVPLFEGLLTSVQGAGTLASTVRAMLAEVYLAVGRSDDAVTVLSELAELDQAVMPPERALMQLASVHRRSDRMDTAREIWQRVVDEYPSTSEAQRAKELLAS